jgi:hypothetical protein
MSYGFNERKQPLIHYSETQERASLYDPDFEGMPPRRALRATRKLKKRGSRKKAHLKPTRGVRFTKGKISLRIAGYSGLQKLGASELVRFIPLSKLKAAAKKVLRNSGTRKTKRRTKNKRTSRK